MERGPGQDWAIGEGRGLGEGWGGSQGRGRTGTVGRREVFGGRMGEGVGGAALTLLSPRSSPLTQRV